MKDKKKVKKWTLLITDIVLLCIVLYMVISPKLFITTKLNYSFLSAPNFNVSKKDNYKTLVKNLKEITLVGESHGLNKTYLFLENLLKTMNEQNKLNYLVLEASPSEAAILNFYLKSGDNNYLVAFINDNMGTSLASQEFINIIKTVKSMNENRKIPIRFIGVDVESSDTMLLYYLKQELQPFSENQNLKEIWARISKATTLSPKECNEILNLIIGKHGMLPLKNEDMFDIEMALTQRYSEQKLTSSEVMLLRDKKMAECFMAYKDYLPKGYFLVNMGSDHVCNNKYTFNHKKIESFGSILNEEKKIQNQIYTINLEYLDSQSMFGEEYGKNHLVSTLPYYTFLKLQDKIVYPDTKAFHKIQDFKKIKLKESSYNMPSVIIILVNSQAVNCTKIDLNHSIYANSR